MNERREFWCDDLCVEIIIGDIGIKAVTLPWKECADLSGCWRGSPIHYGQTFSSWETTRLDVYSRFNFYSLSRFSAVNWFSNSRIVIIIKFNLAQGRLLPKEKNILRNFNASFFTSWISIRLITINFLILWAKFWIGGKIYWKNADYNIQIFHFLKKKNIFLGIFLSSCIICSKLDILNIYKSN